VGRRADARAVAGAAAEGQVCLREAQGQGVCVCVREDVTGGGGKGQTTHQPTQPPTGSTANRLNRNQVLNFSIAYGKTAHGLSKDWGVSTKEAEETLTRWYADRPEVGGAPRDLGARQGCACFTCPCLHPVC
jgi:hypothetical protein